jgi:hypothetical protein
MYMELRGEVNYSSGGEDPSVLVVVNSRQGDQIGRIFAYWARDCSGQFKKICTVALNYWQPLHRKRFEHIHYD